MLDVMKNKEWKKTCRKFFENVYLVALILYIAREFLAYTMFIINWKAPFGELTILNGIFSWFFDTPQYFLSGLLAARLLFLEKYDWKYFSLSAAALVLVRHAWMINHSVNLLMFALLVIGAKEIPFRRIAKAHLIVLALLLAVTISASLTGWIENVHYIRADIGSRYAFGMTYPTNFAAYLFYLMLYFWYYKGEKLSYADIAAAGGLGVFVMAFCRARCSFICFMLAVVFMFVYKKKWENPIMAYVLSFSTTVSAVFMIGLTILYSQESYWTAKINNFLNGRLSLGKKGINIYGFRLWGQAISMNGNAEGEIASKYFFLDSSYMQFAIIYGIVMLGLILLAFYAIGCRARRDGDWAMLWILALIGIHSIMEQHMLEISSCTFILALFASRGGTQWEKQLPGQE